MLSMAGTRQPRSDYPWIIEEDRTFYINPSCTPTPRRRACPPQPAGSSDLWTNFHTSYMASWRRAAPVRFLRSGQSVVVQLWCAIGKRCLPACPQQSRWIPQVYLDPTKRYYISACPATPPTRSRTGRLFGNATPSCGTAMGGAPIGLRACSGSVVLDRYHGRLPATV